MASSRLLLTWEDLLIAAYEPDNLRTGGSSQPVIQRPAEDGLPDVIRIVDVDLSFYIFLDEEEDREVVGGEYEDDGDSFEDDEEEDHYMDSDEEEDEDEDDDLDLEGLEDWTSEDSGYDSMSEDEEDLEDDDDIGRRSPLVQEFPPEEFWHGWRPVLPPLPADVAHPQVPEEQLPQVFPPAGPSAEEPSTSEDSAASTSGHSSSLKRSREESHSEQVSTKRHRWDFEGNLQESAPSTSGLNSSTTRRSWLADWPPWLDDSDSD
ncbi:uncharacterized protein [Trachinotus anak]|uniref:uncharacterized protein n=1 Tax=Trachinotus anak TaxID=443729 RepID=UPI0039F226FC